MKKVKKSLRGDKQQDRLIVTNSSKHYLNEERLSGISDCIGGEYRTMIESEFGLGSLLTTSKLWTGDAVWSPPYWLELIDEVNIDPKGGPLVIKPDSSKVEYCWTEKESNESWCANISLGIMFSGEILDRMKPRGPFRFSRR